MSIPPPAMSIALRQSQMDIFDFILLSRDRFYGRPRRQGFASPLRALDRSGADLKGEAVYEEKRGIQISQ